MAKRTFIDGEDDSIIDARIGILLRVGMLVSAAVILLGGVMYLLAQGRTIPDYRVFHGVPADFRSPAGIVSSALHGHSLGIVQLGLLLLIATPVARVVFSVFAFLSEQDYLYVVISALVLCVLVYSLVWH